MPTIPSYKLFWCVRKRKKNQGTNKKVNAALDIIDTSQDG